MIPVSVKISAIISLVKFAQAFQIHPVLPAKTGNADDSVQTTEQAHAPGFSYKLQPFTPQASPNGRPIILGETRRKLRKDVAENRHARQNTVWSGLTVMSETFLRNGIYDYNENRELGQSLSKYYMENYVTFKH
jgi:hypothetical protein